MYSSEPVLKFMCVAGMMVFVAGLVVSETDFWKVTFAISLAGASYLLGSFERCDFRPWR